MAMKMRSDWLIQRSIIQDNKYAAANAYASDLKKTSQNTAWFESKVKYDFKDGEKRSATSIAQELPAPLKELHFGRSGVVVLFVRKMSRKDTPIEFAVAETQVDNGDVLCCCFGQNWDDINIIVSRLKDEGLLANHIFRPASQLYDEHGKKRLQGMVPVNLKCDSFKFPEHTWHASIGDSGERAMNLRKVFGINLAGIARKGIDGEYTVDWLSGKKLSRDAKVDKDCLGLVARYPDELTGQSRRLLKVEDVEMLRDYDKFIAALKKAAPEDFDQEKWPRPKEVSSV